MNIADFNVMFPKQAQVLDDIETSISVALLKSIYKPSIKIVDSFIYLFSDDVQNTLTNATSDDVILVLYSEAFKRIRSSFLLSLRGYFIDCSALLRSVYELNKAINAIQNGVLTVDYYLSEKRNKTFLDLSKKEQYDAMQAHIRDVDNAVNTYDDQRLPDAIRDSLRLFKSNMHIAVHKALGSIALNLKEFKAGIGGDLFIPFTDLELFGICINNFSFLILMYLKNIIRTSFVNPTNRKKLIDIIEFITRVNKEEKGYHSDIIEYIVIKYK